MSSEIRPLLPDDDRSRFRSGDEALDLYFHRYAGQNQFRHHVGVTYVAIVEERIAGFVSVSAGEIAAATVRKRGVPYPLPVLRVARLAVDESARSSGIGRMLLRHALQLALRMQGDVGCVGVVVDAKPTAIGFYERLGFVLIDLVEGELGTRPASSPLFLPLSGIPEA